MQITWGRISSLTLSETALAGLSFIYSCGAQELGEAGLPRSQCLGGGLYVSAYGSLHLVRPILCHAITHVA